MQLQDAKHFLNRIGMALQSPMGCRHNPLTIRTVVPSTHDRNDAIGGPTDKHFVAVTDHRMQTDVRGKWQLPHRLQGWILRFQHVNTCWNMF
ncbi:hypothetical protein [Rosistilla oblonga]|uniref:hypothetical protein n=1 Tax=Rosistilla oblonga TaxID=2527990 RepID=UPI003A96E6CE